MRHPEISHSKEPIRLFQSNLLEFFTHIHPAGVIVIWAPTALYFLLRALSAPRGGPGLYIPLGFLAGMFLWTLAEYTLHRFLFHFTPHSPRQERIAFLIHGVHHAQPLQKTRLVMPPALSIPLAALFYGLFWLVLGPVLHSAHWLAPLYAGFIAGYLTYDMTHYALHHFRLRSGYYQYMRRYHMRHHQDIPYRRFGVSSPLWDIVFGTKPV